MNEFCTDDFDELSQRLSMTNEKLSRYFDNHINSSAYFFAHNYKRMFEERAQDLSNLVNLDVRVEDNFKKLISSINEYDSALRKIGRI